MLRVNDVHNGECGVYDVNSLRDLLAVTWFVEALNAMNYIDNVKIGLEAYRTCKLPQLANRAAVELINKYNVGREVDSVNSSVLFGIIGPDRTGEAVSVSHLIGSLPDNQHIVQISGSATGKQLRDKTLYPNFFRVIPSDDIQIQVMLQLLLQMQWNYVAIVYDDDDYGRSAATELRRLAAENEVCVPVFGSLPLDAGSADFTIKANDISDQLKNADNGLVRGMVVFGPTSTRHLLPVLQDNANFVQLVISEAVGLQPAVLLTSQRVSSGALVTSPPRLPLPEFVSYWNELWTNRTMFAAHAERNPWLKHYLTQITSCELDDPIGCWDRESRNKQTIVDGGDGQGDVSLYTGYHVKATAILTTVLKYLHDRECTPPYLGVCPTLRGRIAQRGSVQSVLQTTEDFNFHHLAPVSPTLANMSVTKFDDNGDVTVLDRDEDYGVYNLQKTVSADFIFERLDMDEMETKFYHENGSMLTWDQLPPAQCDVNHDCLQCQQDVSNSVIFIEGDFYVVALVPVHAKNPKDLLQCGKMKGTAGTDLAQAVIYAIQNINEKQGQFKNVLPGSKVGLVGISSCGSSLMVKQRLMDFYSGRLLLPDGRYSSALLDYLVGVVGAFYSSNTIAASDTLTSINRTFVQVSAASTNPDLKDRNRHPYFMRLVPADDKQAQVMLDIVKSMNASYIQVIYDSTTAYATALFRKLEEEVTNNDRYNICIAHSIPTVPKDEVTLYNYIVDRLRQKSAARVVIVILHAVEVEKVMDAILPLLTSDDNFLFLASESWGRRNQIIEGRTKLEGSLVLAQEIAADKIFERYFDDLKPENSMNPWLKSFWETRLDCYMKKSFERKGRGACPENFQEDYEQDSRVPFHIQAVYALVKGFDVALKQRCGPMAERTCQALTSSDLVSALRQVKLDLYSSGRESPVFDSNGDGLVGFKVLRVSRDLSTPDDDVIYEDIGQWTSEGLTLKQDKLTTVHSVCPNQAECGTCFLRGHKKIMKNGSNSEVEGLPVSLTAGVGTALGIIIVVLVVVVICLACRRQPSSELGSQNRIVLRQESDPQTGHYAAPAEMTKMATDVQMLPPAPPPCPKRQRVDYLTATLAQASNTDLMQNFRP